MSEPDEQPPAPDVRDGRSTLEQLGRNQGVDDLVSASTHASDGVLGRVVRVTRINSTVVTATEESDATGHPLPVVGDWVLVAREQPDAPLTVLETLPRWSALERHGAAGATEVQVLAVNVDLVFIVVSLDTPLKGGRLDRELVVAWESGARPVVVLTKADRHLAPAEAAAEVVARANDVPVVVTSARDGRGVAELRKLIGPTDTIVLLGASGVGKSTLANRLLGADLMATGGVRSGDGKGRHTTIARWLVAIPGGGVLVDTPGLRGLGLWDVTDGMSLAFGDIEELAAGCRFNDCAHDQEPGCAVLSAVEQGELADARLRSWHKLQEEAANVERQREARTKLDQRRAGRRRNR